MKPKVSALLVHTPVFCFFLTGSALAQNALVNDGAAVYIETGAGIYITGNLENKGTGSFTNAGTVHVSGHLIHNGSGNLNGSASGLFRFNGTGTQQISGTRIPDFYDLSIDKPSGECELQTGITLAHDLSFTSGNLFLNNQQVDLLTTGRLMNESGSSRAYDIAATGTGTIKVVNTLNAPTAVNPGNIGAVVTSAQNMGPTTVIRGHKAQFIHAANSIARYYDITPAVHTGLNATLTFNYFDNELNGQAEEDLVQWYLPDGSAVWLKRGGTVNLAGNFVTLSAIDSFRSRISLVSRNTVPLPVKLIDFKAVKTADEKSLLTWKTADEVDFSRFAIERSADGFTWNAIGEVRALGLSSVIQQYQFTDQRPLQGLNRYRLRMIDTDEDFSYSPVRTVRFGADPFLQVYPTITTGNSQLFVKGILRGTPGLELYDSKGSLLMKSNLAGNSFRLPGLIHGTYLVRIVNKENGQTETTQQIIIL